MKEATSNLNLGVVTLTAIGVMAAFFFTVLWPGLKNNFDKNTSCDDAICHGPVKNGKWHDCDGVKGEYICTYKG